MGDYLKNIAQKAAQQGVDYLRELKNKAKDKAEKHGKNLKEQASGFEFTDIFKGRKLSQIGKSALLKYGNKLKKKTLTGLMKLMEGMSDALDVFQLKKITFDLDIDFDSEKMMTQSKDVANFKATLEAVVFKKNIKKEILLSIGSIESNIDSIFDAFVDDLFN